MKAEIKVGLMASTVIIALLASVGYAAVPSTAPVAIPEEEMVRGTYSTGPNGEAILSFGYRSVPRDAFAVGSGAATVGVNGGALVGDYVAAGIASVAFNFTTDGQMPSAAVVLRTENGTWRNPNVNISTVAGEAVPNNLAFERSAGWIRNYRDSDAGFAAALTKVVSIGISVTPMGQAAQEYTISDFMLIGPDGLTIPAELGPLAGRLWNRFNQTSIAAVGTMGDGDRDGDGVSDLHEAIVGTDDTDEDSVFIAEVLGTTELGTTIRWSSAEPDLIYNIIRTESLVDGDTLGLELTTADTPDVQVINGKCVWTDPDATGAGPYFYRVSAETTVTD